MRTDLHISIVSASKTLSFVCIVLAQATRLCAQTNEETFQQFQWNFAAPGARSNGMGRTFVGISDDQTAVVSNPAGLVTLTRVQGSVEYSSAVVKSERLARSDSLTTGTTTAFRDRANTPAFADFAIPLRHSTTIAMFVHGFLDYREAFQLDARSLPLNSISPGLEVTLLPVTGTTEFHGVAYGMAVATALTPSFSVGFGAALTHLRANAQLMRFTTDAPRGSGTLTEETLIADRELASGVTVGAFWRPSPRMSAGLVYVKSPSFSLLEHLYSQSGYGISPGAPLRDDLGSPFHVQLNVPDRLAVGVATRLGPSMLVAFDLVSVHYSDLAHGTVAIIGETGTSGRNFSISDRVELHTGLEYAPGGRLRLARFRVGVFTVASHELRFVGTTGDSINDAAFAALMNSAGHDTLKVLTAGIGIVAGRHAQLDTAFSTIGDFVTSLVLRR